MHDAPQARATVLGGALVALSHATAAIACPVCFSAQNARVLSAYHLTAALMTALPFVIVGVFAIWLRRHAQRPPQA